MAPYNSRHTAPPALLKSFRQSLQFDGETYSSLRYPAPVYVNLPMGRLREGYERSTATSTPTDFYDECESETEGCADSELGLVKQQPPPSDHLFSLNKKKAIIYLVAVAALFSPLSSNIYFPALQTIAKVSLTLSGLYSHNLTRL
jgi:hypothetical protein